MLISDWSSDVCSSDLLLGVPVDRIPRALEESDFLGQVFLTRREMQNPKAPRYMRKYQPTEADDIETSKHIIESALEHRSEEHTSELQSLMRTSYAVFCLKKKTNTHTTTLTPTQLSYHMR